MSLQFREFTVDIDQRVLLRQGVPVHVAPKVFDTLLILVENSGRIVTKDELMSRLWPDSFVEEANLTFNIQQLRRTLGDNARNPIYIETIARRGYRFIASPEQVLQDSRSGDPITERPEIACAPSGLEDPPEGAIAPQESDLAIKLREQDSAATTTSYATSRGVSLFITRY